MEYSPLLPAVNRCTGPVPPTGTTPENVSVLVDGPETPQPESTAVSPRMTDRPRTAESPRISMSRLYTAPHEAQDPFAVSHPGRLRRVCVVGRARRSGSYPRRRQTARRGWRVRLREDRRGRALCR